MIPTFDRLHQRMNLGLQWAPVIAGGAWLGFGLLALSGLAPTPYLISALLTGFLIVFLLVLHWHSRNLMWSLGACLILVIGLASSRRMLGDNVGLMHFQWITLCLAPSFTVLTLLRTRVRAACERPAESDEAPKRLE